MNNFLFYKLYYYHEKKKSPFAALHSQLHFAALRTTNYVQGVVYDPSGETVPGANVSMKSNPAVGTVTDIDGFSLKASVG